MNIIVIIFIMLVWAPKTNAQANEDLRLLQSLLRDIAIYTPSNREKIEQIEIKIIKNGNPKYAVARKIFGKKSIEFSEAFLKRITFLSALSGIERIRNTKVVENYFLYSNTYSCIVDHEVKSPYEYFKITKEESRQLNSNENQLMVGALNTSILHIILAHEIGHHVEAGLGNINSTAEDIYEMEVKADKWGKQCLLRMGNPPIIGYFYLARMMQIYDQPEFRSTKLRTHPEPLKRLYYSLMGSDDELINLYTKAKRTSQSRAREFGLKVSQLSVTKIVNNHKQIRVEVKKMIEEEKRKTISFYTRIANNSKHPKRAIARHAYIAAHCYLKGIKTTQNDKKALEYFKLAAKNGHTWAKLYCGSMYENGFGVERNLKFARKCYEDAKREKLSLAIIALEAFDTRFPQVK